LGNIQNMNMRLLDHHSSRHQHEISFISFENLSGTHSVASNLIAKVKLIKKDRFTLEQQNEKEPFVIHDNYDAVSGSNFDVCLIKTSEDIYEVGRNNAMLSLVFIFNFHKFR